MKANKTSSQQQIELRQQDGQLVEAKQTIQQQQIELDEISARLIQVERELVEANQTIQDRDDALKTQADDIDEYTDEIETLKAQINALRGTTLSRLDCPTPRSLHGSQPGLTKVSTIGEYVSLAASPSCQRCWRTLRTRRCFTAVCANKIRLSQKNHR